MTDSIYKLISDNLPEPYVSELWQEANQMYDNFERELRKEIIRKINFIVDAEKLKSEGYPGIYCAKEQNEKN
jgi:hypothetical protein